MVIWWFGFGEMVWADGAAPKPSPARPVPLIHAHAHNDYQHPRPLLDALERGFCSIEADIHCVGDQLLVGHDRWNLRPERTLQSLYLDPLQQRVREEGGSIYRDRNIPILLLIDIKTDARSTFERLRDVLKQYDLLFPKPADGEPRTAPVLVVVSGNRPSSTAYYNSHRWLGMDGRIRDLDSGLAAECMPLISDRWSSHFRWRGQGSMPDEERSKLRAMVEKAHRRNRKVRFWGTPENESLWRELLDAGVDLIGTDDLERLQKFLLKRKSDA